MFATGGQKCLVYLLKQYLSRRLQELRDKGPFYLAIIESPKTNVWYKKQRLGVNSINNMMKGVIKNTPLETRKKKLINHTARKTVVKKLRTASVERQSIIQVTGHASEKSLKVYMTQNFFFAYLKGLSKYRRMAFFLISFFVLEILTFFYYAN